MLKKIFFIFLLTVFVGFLTPVHAGAKTGMWEIVMTVNMANLPIQIPPQTIRQCLTKENMIPQTQSAEGCVVTSKGLKGSRVDWTLKCQTAQGPATGAGHMVFKGVTMSGKTTIVIQVEGEKLTTTTLLKGRRVGDC